MLGLTGVVDKIRLLLDGRPSAGAKHGISRSRHPDPKDAINAACREEGHTWKDRLLNPANTIHLLTFQVLNENTALNDVPRRSGEAFTGSALCKARKRLPLGVFKRLLERLADTLLPRAGGPGGDDGRWHGHRVFIMDGSSFSMPDTPESKTNGRPGTVGRSSSLPACPLRLQDA